MTRKIPWRNKRDYLIASCFAMKCAVVRGYVFVSLFLLLYVWIIAVRRGVGFYRFHEANFTLRTIRFGIDSADSVKRITCRGLLPADVLRENKI